MPSLSNIFEKMKDHMGSSYSGDAGKMLLHTGTIAWIVSSAAQILAIIANDKVSKEQKKFMIPQEMADAAINILAFYTLTNGIQNFTKKLVSSGKFITPYIKKFCVEHEINLARDAEENIPNIGKAIMDKVKEFRSVIKVNKSPHINLSDTEIGTLNNQIKELENFYDTKYAPFESGFKIIGNVIGVIVSSNIVTPLLRNPFAAAKQKQAIAQEKFEKYEQMQENLQNPVSPVMPMQNRFKIEDYKKQAVLNSPKITSGGNMKI
ncbi:MAG: hypothetical protein WCY19_04380 [Candidatus Gastranaerophilaceae bacterium]